MSLKNKLELLLDEKMVSCSTKEKEDLIIDILALFENEGLSLIDNGWLDSETNSFIDEVLKRVE